jgi:hypothetical protein
VDGLIWAASMVVLDASRRNQRVPRLALWSLEGGTVGANLARDLGPDRSVPWSALALVCIRTAHVAGENASRAALASPAKRLVAASAPEEPTIDELVRTMHREGTSQRAISRKLTSIAERSSM